MLNPPPLFDFHQADLKAARVGVDYAAGTDRTVVQIVPSDNGEHWYTLANDIANALFDAASIEAVEQVKAKYADDLRALVAARRDLAELLSIAFADRRQQLGRA